MKEVKGINILDKMALKRVQRHIANQGGEPPGGELPEFTIKQINDFLASIRNNTGGDNLSEVVYLTCIKTLYETIGKLNIDLQQDTDSGTKRVYDHEAVKVLRYRANPHLTPTTFKQLMEFNRNHYGNAYAYINRDPRSGRLLSLEPMEPRCVTVLVDDYNMLGTNNTVMYKYTHPKTGEITLLNEKDVLHLKFSLTTPDGLVGKSVQEVLAATMEGAKASQAFLNALYQKGMTASAVLEYVADLDDARVEKLKERIEKHGIGSKNAGGIMPLPPGTKIVPLDLKLSDSQFFELKKYSALQIAAVFGVKPTQLNDYNNASYANSEAQNLSFYVDTLLSIVKQWEEEYDYKLLSTEDIEKGLHFKVNVNSMLRADLKTQSEILSTYVNNGIMMPNEARGKLDLLDDPDGDQLMANGNYIPLSMVGSQYDKG